MCVVSRCVDIYHVCMCCGVLCHAVICCVGIRYIVHQYAVLCRVTLRCGVLCHVMVCYVALRHYAVYRVVTCCSTPCYAVSAVPSYRVMWYCIVVCCIVLWCVVVLCVMIYGAVCTSCTDTTPRNILPYTITRHVT